MGTDNDIRDATIEFQKIRSLGKIFCKICVFGMETFPIETFCYNVYDSSGKVVSGTMMNTNGHNDGFVFDLNPNAKEYFVKVDFSVKGMSKQFKTFVFFSEKQLDGCLSDSEEDEETSDIKRKATEMFDGIIDRDGMRKHPPQPPLQEEEFAIEIEKKKKQM